LKSFVADDIPEGTEVKMRGKASEYIWHQGRSVKKGDMEAEKNAIR
jgi:hypothetical protein